MKGSQRLKPVQRLNEFREDQAARALGAHNAQLANHRKRLDDLLQYQQEYGRQFLSLGQNGIPARKLRDYQAFMDNLTRAIEQQRQIIQQFEAENERLKRQWLAVHHRTKAVDKVVERMVQGENRAEERRIQKELDDRFNRDKS
ncbi:MAG: flagellar export protein FliJ [Gammaproteobacteria bacterium]|nr:flagellar export protein FliJ [Gammaproteobacteria bacterium]